MTCTNIGSLPYVVAPLSALLVRTLRPPGAHVDTPYGRGCQVNRSACLLLRLAGSSWPAWHRAVGARKSVTTSCRIFPLTAGGRKLIRASDLALRLRSRSGPARHSK